MQTKPTNLRVCLRFAHGSDPGRVWKAVHTELTRLLARYKLDHVTVEYAEELPEQSLGGKYREIIPME